MRIGGLVLFGSSFLFGLGAEHYMGSSWISENSLMLMLIGCSLGLAWAIADFWPRLFSSWSSYIWLDMESGARLYRDLLVKNNMREARQMFDTMADPVLDDVNGLTFSFRFIVQDGIKEGQMDVWGVPENGSMSEKITDPDDSVQAHRKMREGNPEFIMQDGVYYQDLKIRRSSIKSYVIHVRNHDAQLKRRSQRQD